MIRSLASIRAEERRPVIGALATLVGIMASHALLETARDALFLESLPPERLPWVYLAIAIVAITLVQVQQRFFSGRDRRAVLGGLLLGSAAVTVGFWALLRHPHPWILGAVYVWAGVYATLVITRFWMLVDDVFTIAQAKRVFAVIGAGSVLGAIVGSAVARAMAIYFEPRQFLLVAAALSALSGALPLVLLQSERRREQRVPAMGRAPSAEAPFCPNPLDLPRCVAMVRGRAYVQRLMGLAVVSAVALTLVDYSFKSTVAESLPGHALAGFFASVYLGLNLVSLVLQLTLVTRLLRRFELSRVMALTPFLLGAGAVMVVLSYTLWPVLVIFPVLGLKAVDGSLRHSLHRTTFETLFVPLTRDVRDQVKAFVDVLGQRGGQALASMAILALVTLPGAPVLLALAVLGLALVWVRLAHAIRDDYLDLFRQTLDDAGLARRVEFPELDMASLETLLEKLNSRDDAEVLAALDLLHDQGRAHLIPALVLYHPSTPVVVRVLEIFTEAGRRDVGPLLERLASHTDPEVRAAVLRMRAVLEPDTDRQLTAFLDDPSAVVRATALVTLVAARWIEGQKAEEALRGIAADAGREELFALVASMQRQPHPVYASLLLELVEREDRALQREVAVAMAAGPDPRFVPALIGLLPYREPRQAARDALLAHGTDALRSLAEILQDESAPQAVRRHIPRTLHRFDDDEAVQVLMHELVRTRDGLVRYKILRALGSMRRHRPDLSLDPVILADAVDRTLAAALRVLDWRQTLERDGRRRPDTPVRKLLLESLDHKRDHATERIFRLLGLSHPEEDWERIYRGVNATDPVAHASSLELLEALVRPPLRDALVAFVDRTEVHEKLQHGVAFYRPRRLRYEQVLAELLEEGSLGLRSLTLYHIGELGLVEFRGQIEELRASDSVFERQVAERALELLRNVGEQAS